MRIAVIAGVFPKYSETFVLYHVKGLMERGHDVAVFADVRPRPHEVNASQDALLIRNHVSYTDAPPIKNGKRIASAPGRFVRCFPAAPGLAVDALNPLHYGGNALNLLQTYRLHRLMSAPHRYDIIHAHFGMVGDQFRFAARLWRAPLVVSFHGFDYSTWPREHGDNCYRRLFKAASSIAVNSDHTRAQLVRLNCPEEKLVKLYPLWNIARFPFSRHLRQPGDVMRVLTVARLVEKKGLRDALDAIQRLRQMRPSVQYDIVGDGPLRQTLERLIATSGLGDCVRLHGSQPQEYVSQMMRDAQVFLMPSVTATSGDQEGFGVVLLEAQASGLPIVATSHGPFPEVVLQERTGFLVPEHNPRELAHRLCVLYDDPERSDQMGRAGREHVASAFSPESILDTYLAHYTQLLRARQSSISRAIEG